MELRNLYAFVTVTNLSTIRKSIQRLGDSLDVKGTILLSDEGINAAISAHNSEALTTMQEFIEHTLGTKFMPLITDLSKKDPSNDNLPFRKLKVRIRPEIVTMGVDGLQPSCITGEFVESQNWNELISDPKTLTIDTRNNYEYYIGHFRHAVNPDTHTFLEFVNYAKDLKHKEQQYDKIAMYCTGGIRCEKASSYMKNLGITNIYQLKGGILRYFEEVPLQESLWEGACFVFDDRIAVNKDMTPSNIRFEDIPDPLHKEQVRNRHAGHVYKKIMSITQS